MEFNQDDITIISIERPLLQEIIDHCRRKLARRYLTDETRDLKAFGLLGGRVEQRGVTVRRVVPLRKNARAATGHKDYMDGAMARHAVPSETPLPERGWVADPRELDAALEDFHRRGDRLIGTYHMHRVPWEHDPDRDTPTELDSVLGKGSRLFMFIISMVDPNHPRVRAFFEGDPNREIPVRTQ